MASETVKKIEEVEKLASNKISEAEDKAKEIIEKAKTDAEAKYDEIIAKAKADAKKLISSTENEYAATMNVVENKRQSIESEMKAKADAKKTEAIDIIKEIIKP